VEEGNEPTEPVQQTNVQKTRSGRTTRVPSQFKDFIVYESSLINDSSYDFTEDIDPVALMMTTSQDTLFFHEIVREPDKMGFVKSMKEEINNHNANRNWIPVRRSTIPAGNKVISSVWAMRRKRRLVDGTVSKWKARLNVDGSKQVHGINYWETYAPVAQWISIRSILCISAINGWQTKTVDFVQAFPQAPSEAELDIDIPKGCSIEGNRNDWAMKVINNIYGQKQAGRVLYKYLRNKLIKEPQFQQSKYDPCVMWKDGCILVIYTDNTNITGPVGNNIDKIIKEVGELFKITHEDSVNGFLGVNIDRQSDGSIVMTQPKLTQEIINNLGLKDNSKRKDIPA
jgi:hypothetical protein